MSQGFLDEDQQMSSDSILDEYEKRRKLFLDYGRRKSIRRWSVQAFSPRQLDAIRLDNEDMDVYNTFLELLLFCSTMILWMSGTVMLAFGFYLLFSHYGWAVMTGSVMYMIGMVLQISSALFILTAAGIATTLLSPDMETPKRTLLGLAIVIVTGFLLLSEIIVCSLSKANQQHKSEVFYNTILSKSVKKTLSQQDLMMARRQGYECKNWENQQCNKLYMKIIDTNINFLIGSASLTLALISIVATILFLVYRTTVHKITRVQPTREYSIQSMQDHSRTIQENIDE